ncbi:hypothetical protein N0V82_006908 [Gnomoniopsis sp. IMI 355080]|nr:hypothetical protein N0V82_006908 [Gnomoniopsis sp. IMI 355080]
MRSIIAPIALLSGLVASETYEWQAPTEFDSRAPCPMLNTLANHGYLPRNGLNFTLAQLQDAFTTAINLAPDFSVGPWDTGIQASTTGVNGTLNLHDLVKHDLIEHDASLSRLDTYFGNANDFNDGVWAQVNASYGIDTVTVDQVAASRVAREAVCAAENPEYNLTSAGSAAGWGEAALFLVVMGNKTTGNASREYVEIFFREFHS